MGLPWSRVGGLEDPEGPPTSVSVMTTMAAARASPPECSPGPGLPAVHASWLTDSLHRLTYWSQKLRSPCRALGDNKSRRMVWRGVTLSPLGCPLPSCAVAEAAGQSKWQQGLLPPPALHPSLPFQSRMDKGRHPMGSDYWPPVSHWPSGGLG